MAIFRRSRDLANLPPPPALEARYDLSWYLNELATSYTFNGSSYNLPINFTQPGKKQLPITGQYMGLQETIRSNAPVFAVFQTRKALFTEARFMWQNRLTGKTFGDGSLSLLETPWPNGTSGDLLSLMELGVTAGGNAYLAYRDGRLRWLRPDWTSIIISSTSNPGYPAFAWDVEIVGYVYQATGVGATDDQPIEYFPVNEVVHWTPIPDPIAPWRGMSWLSPIVREVMADSATTDHKLSFFEHGATPNLVIKFPETVTRLDQFEKLRDSMEASHGGVSNAWKTLYLAAGADATVVGANLGDMNFTSLQGGGEVRIANAGGVPASVAGFNEALKGSSLNTGNFSAARRLFADLWARPQWRSVCAALEKLLPVPGGARLWYDDRNIAFLREDQEVEATMQQTRSSAIQILINSGYKPDAAVAYVMSNDPSVLVGQHTGLVSVQLQPPGSQESQGDTEPAEPTEPPDDERDEMLDFANAASKLALGVGKVIDVEDARGILRYGGAPIADGIPDDLTQPEPDPEDLTEAPETPGETPDPEDLAEPPEAPAA